MVWNDLIRVACWKASIFTMAYGIGLSLSYIYHPRDALDKGSRPNMTHRPRQSLRLNQKKNGQDLRFISAYLQVNNILTDTFEKVVGLSLKYSNTYELCMCVHQLITNSQAVKEGD